MSVKKSAGGEEMAGRLMRAVVVSFILLPLLNALHADQMHQAVNWHAICFLNNLSCAFTVHSELNPRVTIVSVELPNQFCSFWPSLLLLYNSF